VRQRATLLCGEMVGKKGKEDDCLHTVVFSDEDYFYPSGEVNCHNARIRGTETPHGVAEHVRDSPKLTSHLPGSLAFCSVRSHIFFPSNPSPCLSMFRL
jgi:hypothetical protein